jgi:hypothetical protein
MRSEQLVVHGMQGTRNNQRMFEEIAALERTARLYQIIGNAELLDVYTRNHDRLVTTHQRTSHPAARRNRRPTRMRCKAEAERLLLELRNRTAEFGAHGGSDQRLSAVSELASKVSNRVSAQIDPN